MGGTVTARSTLIQTSSSLHFELRPTLDLDGATAYMIINVPKSLQFQGPSCTVTDIAGGLNTAMRCSRISHQITLSQPFIGFFNASTAETLSMTVAEFLMPSSVQDLGAIQVVTYDIRRDAEEIKAGRPGRYRPIDMAELTELKTHSGTITKLSDVEVSSKVTSAMD